ncbi:MAG: DUF881 domain-containing protein [Actinomycetota bacterium]|nr:DUF881 domain-containing protein [Actinomycetota bacterium]
MSSRADDQAERISLGLIEYLSRHTLDEDYAWIARNRKRQRPGRRRRGAGVAGLLALVLFGLLVYTAASQTTRNAVTEEKDRQQLIDQIHARRSSLATRQGEVTLLRSGNNRLQTSYLKSTLAGSRLFTSVQRLSALTGASTVRGPGVRVVVDDAPNATADRNRVLDSDLQKLVNALWESGAEAISINGQRITILTSIRQAGEAINVNYRPLKRPYTLLVVGNPKTIPSRFAETTHGATWFDLQNQVGLRFDMTPSESLTLPASDRLALRFAARMKGGAS